MTAPPPLELTGTAWLASELGGEASADRVRSTLVLTAADRAAGSTGCNRWAASLTREGSGLTFGEAITTRMACPPAAMAQEQRFLAALAATRSWSFDGATLTLRDATGQPIARLGRDRGDI